MSEQLTTRRTQIQTSLNDLVTTIGQTLSTSLGPKGLDKMLTSKNKTIITNDGATILDFLGKNAKHPIVRLLDSVSKTQDMECGDGTTTVILLLSELFTKMNYLMQQGVSKSQIISHLKKCTALAEESIFKLAYPVFSVFREESKIKDSKVKLTQAHNLIKEKVNNLKIKDNINDSKVLEEDRKKLWEMEESQLKEALKRAALTSLSSKIVSSIAELSDLAVETMLTCKGEMKNIKIIKIKGATDDSFYFRGLGIQSQKFFPIKSLQKNRNVKTMVIKFCLSAPKTNLDSKIIINNAELMDQTIKEERDYILSMCKKIKHTGTELLILQKSILRESASELAVHYLNKLGISVLDGVERSDVALLEKCFNITAVSDIDFVREQYVKNILYDQKDGVFVFNSEHKDSTICTVVLKGENDLLLDEVERSMNDAFGVVKSLMLYPYLVPGGGVVEIEISKNIRKEKGFINNAIADAFEIIPFLLAKNAGMDPIETVTMMKVKGHGINVSTGNITDMVEENVLQPVKVSLSSLRLAIETTIVMLNVDDILPSKN
ncbi:hypothetical protein H312_00312 [Anncaliia algerae PRA339]|uniref:T-complex protein 1, delta subunit n=1 Tax=Anncaliia algerae PRA339 TaxID=1288291 RepID=A0A059F5L4_9MICR|nr:hypothetical protein H312_00312 [Anncaliia algerae PRA339]